MVLNNDRVFEDIKIIEIEGKKQFLHFQENRLVSADLSINVTIPLNSYNLPGNYNKKSAYDPLMTEVMMTKFVDASKNRRYLVEDALNVEILGIAQSLTSDQFSLYHGTKSSFNKFDPNKRHKKNSTRCKWLRDLGFHASSEDAKIEGANLVQQIRSYYGSIF